MEKNPLANSNEVVDVFPFKFVEARSSNVSADSVAPNYSNLFRTKLNTKVFLSMIKLLCEAREGRARIFMFCCFTH